MSDSLGSVDSIVGGAKGKGGGKGKGPTIAVVFFADGFMVDEDFDPEETDEEEKPAEAPAAAPARRGGTAGMMSLSDLPKSSRGAMPKLPKLPKLKPLRSYEENKEFLDMLKNGQLPRELQKRDEEGNPIPAGIAIEDARPRTYKELDEAIKQVEQMQKGAEPEPSKPAAKSGPTLFAGAGHSLAGPSGPSDAASSQSSSGPGAEAGLLALVSARPSPVADASKPTTSLQLRLSTGARIKAQLNLEHTVADIWKLVADNMGMEAFKNSSQHELSAGFPPKPLADASLTLAAADLANAAITHRCK